MITKQDILDFYPKEIALTIKVLKAVPENQLDFRAHEKSSSIRDLIRTFIAEMELNKSFLQGVEPADTMKKVPEFDFIAEGIATFETRAQEFLAAAKNTSEEDFLKPFSIWGMDSTRGLMIFMMLSDMIHHRGQMSVYVRLAGGLVPAIYGPSADDNGGF